MLFWSRKKTSDTILMCGFVPDGFRVWNILGSNPEMAPICQAVIRQAVADLCRMVTLGEANGTTHSRDSMLYAWQSSSPWSLD